MDRPDPERTVREGSEMPTRVLVLVLVALCGTGLSLCCSCFGRSTHQGTMPTGNGSVRAQPLGNAPASSESIPLSARCASPAELDRGRRLGRPRYGIAFPPMADEKGRAVTASHVPALGIKRIRYSENWRFREPRRGEYYWQPMDDRIAFCERMGFRLLLTIESYAPAWMERQQVGKLGAVFSDYDAFGDFVTALSRRYAGRIAQVQFGNEWDNPDAYPGTAQDMIRATNLLYDAFKANSPTTRVVLGSMTYALFALRLHRDQPDLYVFPLDSAYRTGQSRATLEAYIRKYLARLPQYEARVGQVLAGARYDAIDIHLYDDPENWAAYLDAARAMCDKPVIVSEFGCPNPTFERYDPEYHARRLEVCLRALDALAVEEAYYFSLITEGDASAYHVDSGLLRGDLSLKPAYEVLRKHLQSGPGVADR